MNWYDTLEEAIQDTSKFDRGDYKDYVLSTEIIRIEMTDKCIIFHTLPSGYADKHDRFGYVAFAREGQRISQAYERSSYTAAPGWGDNDCFYDWDDGVVDYIVLELYADRVLYENGLGMFFGVWHDKEEIESVTIADIPLEIVEEPILADGEEYYFWNITDLSWTERFSGLDWSSITWGQIIEALDIQYVPMQAEEEKQ